MKSAALLCNEIVLWFIKMAVLAFNKTLMQSLLCITNL